MKTKFLLESFDDYVSEFYNTVNEAEGQTLSKKEAFDVIGQLVKNQKGRAMNNSKIAKLVTEVFGNDIAGRIRKDWWWADEREGISNSPDEEKTQEFFKKIVEFDQKLAESDLKGKAGENESFIPAVIMGLFYQFVAKDVREKLAEDFAKKASELKLTAEKITKQIEEKAGDTAVMGKAPAILGYVSADEIKRVTETPGQAPETFSFLDDVSQKTLFLDNSWELNPTVGKQLREQIYGLLERRKSGGKILELTIQSSASRYRNTGKAEGLSWGQLAFKRYQVIYNMFKEVLDELGIKEGDPIRQELNSVAKTDIAGSNGDGTSGPNPIGATGTTGAPGLLRVGYYQTTTDQSMDQTGSSKFIDKEASAPEKVYIVKTDNFGNSEGDPVVKEMPILKSKAEYEVYKYVNVIAKVQGIGTTPGIAPSVSVKTVPVNTLAPEIILAKKGEKGEGGGFSFKFKMPKFQFKPRAAGASPFNPCKGKCGCF